MPVTETYGDEQLWCPQSLRPDDCLGQGTGEGEVDTWFITIIELYTENHVRLYRQVWYTWTILCMHCCY